MKAARDGSTKVVNKYQMPFSAQVTSRDGFVATAFDDYDHTVKTKPSDIKFV